MGGLMSRARQVEVRSNHDCRTPYAPPSGQPNKCSSETHAATHFSIASWALSTAMSRWEIKVHADRDVTAVPAPPTWTSSTTLCIYSRSTGEPIDNYFLTRHANLTVPSHLGMLTVLHFVFEPASGPGVYEVYASCRDAHAAPVQAKWRNLAETSIGHATNGSLQAIATPFGHVLRSEVMMGVQWPKTVLDKGLFYSAGSVRAFVRTPRGPRQYDPVRVFVPWRRPCGSAVSYGRAPLAFHVTCSQKNSTWCSTDQVPVALTGGDEDEIELLLLPKFGGGRHVIYPLPFVRASQPFDAIGTPPLRHVHSKSGLFQADFIKLPGSNESKTKGWSLFNSFGTRRGKAMQFGRETRGAKNRAKRTHSDGVAALETFSLISRHAAKLLRNQSTSTQRKKQLAARRNVTLPRKWSLLQRLGLVSRGKEYEALQAKRHQARASQRTKQQAKLRAMYDQANRGGRRLAEGLNASAIETFLCVRADSVQSRSAFDHIGNMDRAAHFPEVRKMVNTLLLMKHRGGPDGRERRAQASGTASVEDLSSVLLFPESRRRPLRTTCALPRRWALKGPSDTLTSTARPNEFFTWHVGVHARVHNLTVINCSLKSVRWEHVPPAIARQLEAAVAIRCINILGVGYDGAPVRPKPNVNRGCVRDFWFGVQLPAMVPTVEKSASRQLASLLPSWLRSSQPASSLHTTASQPMPSPVLHLHVTLEAIEHVATEAAEDHVTSQHRATQVAMTRRRTLSTHLALTVDGPPVSSSGDGQHWRLSRLRWLDSVIGHANDVPPPQPFTPVQSSLVGSTLDLTARMGRARVGALGLPTQLYAGTERTVPVLVEPIALDVMVTKRGPTMDALSGRNVQPVSQRVEWSEVRPLQRTPAPRTSRRVAWQMGASGLEGALRMTVHGSFEYDTEMRITVRLEAIGRVAAANAFSNTSGQVRLDDVALHLPVDPELSTFLMGFGHHGRRRKRASALSASSRGVLGYHPWEWERGTGAHLVWLGDVRGGVRLKLAGPSQAWDSPMHRVTAAELHTLSWHNHGAGKASIFVDGRVQVQTGPMTLVPGKPVDFVFELLLTPCQPLQPRLVQHWHEHYTQQGYPAAKQEPLAAIARRGANVINYHQGIGVNPYINYPFVRRAMQRLAQQVALAHEHGLRAKAYYTIRELSNHAAELWVLRSLGSEVLRGGAGMAGDPWLMEHLLGGSGYAPCWHNALDGDDYDAAICNKGLSRWANYYVEGLGELLREGGLDGLYYDGIDFGIETIRRVRAVLQRERGTRGLLDLHSGNNNNPNYKGRFGSVSPALQYMGVFPHVDSLWFGEGYDYNQESADYWLVEVSGLPFGLPGNLMCDSGYKGAAPWRGMLYGTMGRHCTYADNDGFGKVLARPDRLWALLDVLKVDNASMVGYWEQTTPVRVQGCTDVRATSYVRHGHLTLIALASWWSPAAVVPAYPVTPTSKKATNATTAANATGANATATMRMRLHQPLDPGSFEGLRRRPVIKATCSLVIDWAALGLNSRKATAFAPRLRSWQNARKLTIRDAKIAAVPVVANRGLLVVVASAAAVEALPAKLRTRRPPSMNRSNEEDSMRVWGSLVR